MLDRCLVLFKMLFCFIAFKPINLYVCFSAPVEDCLRIFRKLIKKFVGLFIFIGVNKQPCVVSEIRITALHGKDNKSHL